MAIDKEMLQRYRATGTCPFCGAANPEGDQVEFEENGMLSQRMSCPECEKTWHDVYRLVDILPAE
jgi:hypothetical protein